MCDKRKLLLFFLSLIFIISLFIIMFINSYEIRIISDIEVELKKIYICMALKLLIIIITFYISLYSMLYLFKKEVHYDYMTGLYSRRKLFEDLNNLINKRSLFTVCYIDLNNFKCINDMYGHKTGDMLLKEFSKRIHTLKSKGIIGYRIGGDEFVLIINNHHESKNCIESIMKITDKEVVVKHIGSIKIEFAIGIKENDFISTAEMLLEKADSSMYQNKKAYR